MASGLYSLQAGISRHLARCIKLSSDIASYDRSRWRSLTSFAISPSFVHDAEEEQQPSIATSNTGFELQSLKQREKGDWKKLTLEEKQAFRDSATSLVFQNRDSFLVQFYLGSKKVYRMSFSQPFHVLDQPANEWKLILAGTFTAMGLTALAMYMWNSQFEKTEEVIGPMSTKKKDTEASLFYGNDLSEKSV